LLLLPGVLDFEPFGDDFASGIVFRSLPFLLLPGVFVLAPDDDDPEGIPPEEL
jgi:hypothetical protein